MQQLIILLLKSIACSSILFAYYLLFLRNKKLHIFNRFYLLMATLISLVVPFLEFKSYTIVPMSTRGIELLDTISMDKKYEVITDGPTSIISTDTIALYAYTLVSFFLFIILLARVAWIFRLKRRGQVECKSGYTFVLTDSTQAPFSFFNYLFWKKDLDATSASSQQIIIHELCHIRQRHTLDKIFMQVVVCAAWGNPIFWFIRKELALQHEFIADDAAIQHGDTESFAKMILGGRYSAVTPDIIHPFFYSPIKRRLLMLTQSKKTTFSPLRRFMLLPLAGILLVLFSFKLDVPEVNRANKRISVVFDAGHGGNDDGAKGAKGVLEKNLTLRICNKLVSLAPEYNIKASLTRKDDNYIALPDRIALTESISPDIFVAIHVDQSYEAEKGNDYNIESHKAEGFEVVMSGRNKFPDESKLLASAILPKLKILDIPTKFTQRGILVVNEANRPAILIECGNIDNPKQVVMLTDDTQLENVCRQILSGIADYQNNLD